MEVTNDYPMSEKVCLVEAMAFEERSREACSKVTQQIMADHY